MDMFKSYNKLTMGFNTSSLRQMSREASKPPQMPFSDQTWVWHTKQASCLFPSQVPQVTGGAGVPGRSLGIPLQLNGEWGRLPWVSPCSQAVRHWLLNPQEPSPATSLLISKWGTQRLDAVPGLVKGHSLKPLSLQQLPQRFQLLAFLGPAGNLFLVWVESDCLGFFSIFPLSGKIIWMKENRAKITFPHSWAAPPLH